MVFKWAPHLSWGHLGVTWGHLGGLLEPSWDLMDPSWDHLGPLWGHFGTSSGHFILWSYQDTARARLQRQQHPKLGRMREAIEQQLLNSHPDTVRAGVI